MRLETKSGELIEVDNEDDGTTTMGFPYWSDANRTAGSILRLTLTPDEVATLVRMLQGETGDKR